VTATTTTRLSLYKTSSDGSDLVNVVTDLLNNWDSIDLNIGYRDCTSTTRPSTVWRGLPIRESDTGRLYLSNGSAPASASWVEIPSAGASVLSPMTFAGAVGLNSTLAVTGAATLSSTLGVTGAATFSSTLRSVGAASLNSTLAVTGATTLNNNLTVAGTGSATSLGGTLAVTGNFTGAANQVMGAWTSHTPTWTATTTNPSLGNGTLVSRWCRIGRTIHWQGLLTCGSTTTGGGAIWFMSLPTPIASVGLIPRGTADFVVAGSNNYVGEITINPADSGGATFVVKSSASSQGYSYVGGTSPVSTSSSCSLAWSITYEAAS
jgi:hypothetical protein